MLKQFKLFTALENLLKVLQWQCFMEKVCLNSICCINLRTKVRGDLNIHGTKYFQDVVFHEKKYDVPLVGQKTRPTP